MQETPYAIGMSLYMYDNFRSQQAVTMLHKCSAGISYDRVTKVCTTVAGAIQEQMFSFVVYVPSGLVKGIRIRTSLDNIDLEVDTVDGTGSFHGLAAGVYQSKSSGEAVTGPLNLKENLRRSGLSNVPKSVIELAECSIEGNPTPKSSLSYSEFKLGMFEEQVSELQESHSAELQENLQSKASQAVPIWSGYNSLLGKESQEKSPSVDNSHMMPIINAPPQDWTTLVTGLLQLYNLNQIVSPGTSADVTLDMDLYKRVLKLEYLDRQYSDK